MRSPTIPRIRTASLLLLTCVASLGTARTTLAQEEDKGPRLVVIYDLSVAVEPGELHLQRTTDVTRKTGRKKKVMKERTIRETETFRIGGALEAAFNKAAMRTAIATKQQDGFTVVKTERSGENEIVHFEKKAMVPVLVPERVVVGKATLDIPIRITASLEPGIIQLKVASKKPSLKVTWAADVSAEFKRQKIAAIRADIKKKYAATKKQLTAPILVTDAEMETLSSGKGAQLPAKTQSCEFYGQRYSVDVTVSSVRKRVFNKALGE